MAKIYLVLLTGFLFFQNLAAQYIPIPDSGAVWRQNSWAGNSLDGGTATYRQIFEEGDTIINGLKYIRLFQTGYDYVNEIHSPNGTFGFTHELYGFFRNDTINKKVFFINAQDTTVLLLYDFNLNVGDTIPSDWYGAFDVSIVYGIDTVELFGLSRRRFHLSSQYSFQPMAIIEGIGSVSGFAASLITATMGISGQLECFSVKDSAYTFSPEPIYSGSTCWPYSAIENNLVYAQKIISPNPFTTSFTLQLSSPPNTQTYFQLYDALGRQVKREEITSASTTINRNNLPNGVYFWQLQQANKIVERGKVVMD
ncbi:MAG: T9SS type A sorting domain-containing protein [Bacteroidota bacterium]